MRILEDYLFVFLHFIPKIETKEAGTLYSLFKQNKKSLLLSLELLRILSRLPAACFVKERQKMWQSGGGETVKKMRNTREICLGEREGGREGWWRRREKNQETTRWGQKVWGTDSRAEKKVKDGVNDKECERDRGQRERRAGKTREGKLGI